MIMMAGCHTMLCVEQRPVMSIHGPSIHGPSIHSPSHATLNSGSAFGQCFVFYTINEFGPLLLTTLTTTRKVSIRLGISGVRLGFIESHAQLYRTHQPSTEENKQARGLDTYP